MTDKLATLSELISFVNSQNYVILEDKDVPILDFKPISTAKRGDATFCSYNDDAGLQLILNSGATLIICHSDMRDKLSKPNTNLIFVERPRLWFIRCLKKFFPINMERKIHPTAVLESNSIGKNVYIGPFTYVGKNVIIGENTIIYGNVYIYDNVKIGKNVIIHAASVIGSDGFGFEINEENKLEKFPHIGSVEIHDDVEIGASNCVDRGTLDNTIVGQGTKTDNNVHIAHNVKIGKNCAFAAGVTLSGSCIIEDDVYFGTSAVVRDWIKIGKKSFIGIGSVVVKDVPSNTTVMGVPAKPINKIIKSWTDREN